MPKKLKLPKCIRFRSEIWEKGKNKGPRAEGEKIEMKTNLSGLVLRDKKVPLREDLGRGRNIRSNGKRKWT